MTQTATAAPPRIAVPELADPAAFAGHDPAARVVILRGAAMGTTWQVHAALPTRHRDNEATLAQAIAARLSEICAQMSHWDAGSLLSRFNTAPAGSVAALPEDFAAVMACSLAIAKASGGAFDPALGRLTDLWGLGPNPRSHAPTPGALAEALAASGWQRLAFDPAADTDTDTDTTTAMLHQPGGVWLDLSGVAKGYAVDAIAALLAARGVRHALVEIGGEWTGRGMRPDGDPWWVDLETPPAARLPGLRIALHQLAVATSGDYLRGAHTLDPATGQPLAGAATAVSVLHTSCMVADAWATALGVVPFAEAQRLAHAHALPARIVLRSGKEWLSPAMHAML